MSPVSIADATTDASSYLSILNTPPRYRYCRAVLFIHRTCRLPSVYQPSQPLWQIAVVLPKLMPMCMHWVVLRSGLIVPVVPVRRPQWEEIGDRGWGGRGV